MLLSDKGMLLNGELSEVFYIILAEVLAAGRQLVAHEGWQHLLQLQEEPLAWLVGIGVHVVVD